MTQLLGSQGEQLGGPRLPVPSAAPVDKIIQVSNMNMRVQLQLVIIDLKSALNRTEVLENLISSLLQALKPLHLRSKLF
jgi:hypothetical protein